MHRGLTRPPQRAARRSSPKSKIRLLPNNLRSRILQPNDASHVWNDTITPRMDCFITLFSEWKTEPARK